LEQVVAITNTNWMPAHLTEDGDAWYITYPQCSTCQYIHGAKAPICAAGESYLNSLIRQLLGHRVLATEVECAGTGATHCKQRIPK
jgi:predicted hydrocarbon binding protein